MHTCIHTYICIRYSHFKASGAGAADRRRRRWWSPTPVRLGFRISWVSESKNVPSQPPISPPHQTLILMDEMTNSNFFEWLKINCIIYDANKSSNWSSKIKNQFIYSNLVLVGNYIPCWQLSYSINLIQVTWLEPQIIIKITIIKLRIEVSNI